MEVDITDRIRVDFSPTEVSTAISILEESGKCEGRIARCIVVGAAGSLEELRRYVQATDIDVRDVIVAGEYDAGFRQLRDLRASFLIDAPEKFWIGALAAALYARGYVLQSLTSRRATCRPFDCTADEGEGVAEFVGSPVRIEVEKSAHRWSMRGNPDDLEPFDLNRSFDNERAFIDAVSCYILAKQHPRK